MLGVGDLKDGPLAIQTPDELDTKLCLQHKENDYVYIKHRDQWIPKQENKHYHVWKLCLKNRNPHFNVDDVLFQSEKQPINHSVKSFLRDRLR